jgi:hypothetical protein
MAKGKTASALSLTERREAAGALIRKGFTNAEIARKLRVSPDTAAGYRKWNEERHKQEIADNPHFMNEVLSNTLRNLREIDEVRKEAWKQYHTAEVKQVKLQALNTVRACQQDRARIYGLLGVDQATSAMYANIKFVQDRILEFLNQELCDVDRERLRRMLISPEFKKYFGESHIADEIIDVPFEQIGSGQ